MRASSIERRSLVNAASAVMSLPEAPVLLLTGCLLMLCMWLLASLRGERLPARTLVEGTLLTLLASGAALLHLALHPIIFVAVLYAVLMRVRLCVDAGNLLAARGLGRQARAVYNLGLRLGATAPDRVLVLLNEGILAMKQARCGEALSLLTQAAEQRLDLGTKQQAGCLLNLGVCYEKLGRTAEALRTYAEAAQAHPVSEFGRRAQQAMNRIRAARKGEVGQ